jgi:oxygen-dependent protoporphyrinogen oxidase
MIVIVGAGISGLAAAYELSQRRVEFRLLEASSRIGGLIQTDHVDGFTIDAGPDSFLAAKPSARELCDQVGLMADIQQMNEPRTAFVLRRHRLFPLPSPSVFGIPQTTRAAATFDLLPVHARMRLLLEPYMPRASARDESIAAFFRRRFGPASVSRIAQPLLGGIHAGDVERLSVRSLFPTLLEAEASGGVLRGLKRPESPSGGMFHSLAGGMATLPKGISQRLPHGAIEYDAPVQSISPTADGWRIDTSSGSYDASAVLVATPLHETSRLLTTVDSMAAQLCAEVPHASTASIALGWRRDVIPHPLRGSGFVVVRGSFRITACTWASSKWEGRAPNGYALLRAFVGGTHDPDAVSLDDDQLVGIARRELGRVLGITAAPEVTRVYRWHDASPQLNVGHDERVRQIARQLDRHHGLFVTGRGLRAIGIPDCIADARAAASRAAEYISRKQINASINHYQHG